MIFIWIPKTGGTTYVSEQVPEMKIVTEDYHKFDGWMVHENITFGHAHPWALIDARIIPKSQWDWHDKIAIVRNPYDRFVSLFHDYKRTGRIPQDFTQLQFIRAIKEMRPVPGLYNSDHLSMAAPQMCWIIPGVICLRFEELQPNFKTHLNSGNHSDQIDPVAKRAVLDFYRADFTVLNYDEA